MILDTNAVSALAGRETSILRLLEKAPALSLSFVSVAEFRYGLHGSTRPEAGLALLEALATHVPVLFPDAETIGHYAWIADHLKRKGRPIPHNDVWTAALARQHALPVISRDRHFDFIDGIQRVEW
ncbi:MAG TPA: PIN domain-containing protein [Luteolibacter sp.]|jgi:predicted nucleic acid-binding protein